METQHVNWKVESRTNDVSEEGDISSVYNEHYEILLNYGAQFNLDKSSVQDCIHDLFVDLWRGGKPMDGINSKKAYLLRALKNKIYKKLKKNTRIVGLDGTDLESNIFPIQISTEQSMIISQTVIDNRDALNKSLESLTPRQRELIYHIFYNGLSYEEASEILNISKKTAYNLVLRSINKLREHIDLSQLDILLIFLLWK